MNLQDFRVGSGPDFVMTKGKVIYPHQASMALVFDNCAESKLIVSNPSLQVLLTEIKERLVAIGWSKGDGIQLLPGINIVASAKGPRGRSNIQFKFPKELSAKQESAMLRNIRGQLG